MPIGTMTLLPFPCAFIQLLLALGRAMEEGQQSYPVLALGMQAELAEARNAAICWPSFKPSRGEGPASLCICKGEEEEEEESHKNKPYSSFKVARPMVGPEAHRRTER